MPEIFDPAAGAPEDDGGWTGIPSTDESEQQHDQRRGTEGGHGGDEPHDDDYGEDAWRSELDPETGELRVLRPDDPEEGAEGGGDAGSPAGAVGAPTPEEVAASLEGDLPKRIRTGRFNERDVKVLKLMDDHPGLSMREAMEFVDRLEGGTAAAAPPTGPTTAPPEATPAGGTGEQGDPIAQLDAEIAELQRKSDDAFDEADFKEGMRLERELRAAERRRDAAERDQQTRQAQAAQARTAERQRLANLSYQKAVSVYPELGEEEGDFGRAYDERYQALVAARDPIFHAPNWPELLAHQIAGERRLAELRGAGGGTPPRQGNVPENPRAAGAPGAGQTPGGFRGPQMPRPLVTPAPTSGRAPRRERTATAEEIRWASARGILTPEQRAALLDAGGTQIK